MAVLDNSIKSMILVYQVYENADKMEQLMDRQALLQDKIDALGAWEIDTKLEIAWMLCELQKRYSNQIYLVGNAVV
jgi:hypothetical protein